MKNILLAAASLLALTAVASAADMPSRAAPVAYAPAPVFTQYNWTGFYVGVNVGGGLQSTNLTDHNEYFTYGSANYSEYGVLGGAQVGYNWQFGPGVIGLEADINATSFKSKYDDPDWDARARSSMPWFATVRARAGVAVGPALIYGTAGLALLNLKQTVCEDTCSAVNEDVARNSGTSAGIAVGAGVEYALSGNWTVKAEYLYLTAREKNAPVSGADDSYDSVRWKNDFHIARVGVNYRFGGTSGGAPVVARY